MIERPQYLHELISWKDQNIIKVVSGVRRSGKSSLFMLYQTWLKDNGVEESQIININLEDPANEKLLKWKKLYDSINKRLLSNKKNYVFIDEIQIVKDFQRAADGLFIKENVDLYLTGSNSKLQSGEWATMLSGRYVEIHIFPLSFKEYVAAYPFNDNRADRYQNYLRYSSFPYILEMMRTGKSENLTNLKKITNTYLKGIYNTIVLKDIAENKRIKDVGRLENVIKFMSDNIGSISSANNIANTMTSNGIKIDNHTIENYLRAFCDSYILYRAERYDVKGKKLLKNLDKFYLVDIGLRFFMLGDRQIDTGRMLENIVYLELKRRNNNVYVGKIDVNSTKNGKKSVITTEIDFVAESDKNTEYYQVAESVMDKSTLNRELMPLQQLKNHNPKYLLTMDPYPEISHNGIKQINVLDWLLESSDF